MVGHYQAKFQACPGAPIQPGTSCDVCGTGIMEVFEIRSADGKVFKAGCECVKKTGDRGLVDAVKREVSRLRTKARHMREGARVAAVRERLADPAVRQALNAQPHPLSPETYPDPTWAGSALFVGKTRLDWTEWMMANAGSKGRLEVARYVERLEAEAAAVRG